MAEDQEKTINIPKSIGYPYATFFVNNRRYTYPTGKDVTVPDFISDIVDGIIKQNYTGSRPPAATVTLLATMEDGTTKTYELVGREVT